MATPHIHAGAGALEYVRVIITQDSSTPPLDLSTVTACTLKVTRRNGTSVFWDAVIESQSATELIVRHYFADADVPDIGRITIMPYLTVPGGTRRAMPFTLPII